MLNHSSKNLLLATISWLLLQAPGAWAAEPAPAVVAATGAAITEGDYQVVLTVAPTGDDTASGLEGTPLKTVSHAVELGAKAADQGKSVRIRIRAGVYRERVMLPKQKVDNPGVLCLEGEDGAILSGADLWQQGWQRFYVTQEGWKWDAGDQRFDKSRIYKHD